MSIGTIHPRVVFDDMRSLDVRKQWEEVLKARGWTTISPACVFTSALELLFSGRRKLDMLECAILYERTIGEKLKEGLGQTVEILKYAQRSTFNERQNRSARSYPSDRSVRRRFM